MDYLRHAFSRFIELGDHSRSVMKLAAISTSAHAKIRFMPLRTKESTAMPKCDRCGKEFYSGDGVWGAGDNRCGECLADDIAAYEEKNPPKPASEPDGK